ncbi:MAG TPA: GntR family transcriptional regulator [Solirubrobacteraceae bacterium]|jgi:DNA-binding transcriptional regulator YhcF (GntR family)|nr:GntR family transcriptional regulator [Solirubrobacteraceae bacterium]
MARGDHREVSPSEAHSQAPLGTSAQMGVAEAQFDLGDLKIDRNGEIPIGVQLAWALRARIGDKRLAPGQRLPGLRELGEMLGINANTARAVYQRLEQEGLIDSRQGTGTFVAQVTQEPSAVGQIAADAAQQARRTGVDPREVAAALYVATGPPADATALAAERRRELRAQIAALEQALSEMQARHPGLIPAPSKPLRHAGPRLLGVKDLEGVRGELVRRLAEAEPAAEARVGDARAASRARARETTARSDTRAGESPRPPDRQGKPEGAKKATRPRPRTRPSTA